MDTYFVISDTDAPERIYFTLEAAKEKFPHYIDAFDETGMRIKTYERNEIDADQFDYTESENPTPEVYK